MTWQPSETAPKDGTWVLLYDTDTEEYALAQYVNGEWRDYGDIGAAGMVTYEPTHWMPLPGRPQ